LGGFVSESVDVLPVHGEFLLAGCESRMFVVPEPPGSILGRYRSTATGLHHNLRPFFAWFACRWEPGGDCRLPSAAPVWLRDQEHSGLRVSLGQPDEPGIHHLSP
jgi:hypothetical protein